MSRTFLADQSCPHPQGQLQCDDATSTEGGVRILTAVICINSIATKQTPWPLVRKRTIPTERPPLVDEI
jgi:hypothetical protein